MDQKLAHAYEALKAFMEADSPWAAATAWLDAHPEFNSRQTGTCPAIDLKDPVNYKLVYTTSQRAPAKPVVIPKPARLVVFKGREPRTLLSTQHFDEVFIEEGAKDAELFVTLADKGNSYSFKKIGPCDKLVQERPVKYTATIEYGDGTKDTYHGGSTIGRAEEAPALLASGNTLCKWCPPEDAPKPRRITPELLRHWSMQAIGKDMRAGSVDWVEFIAGRLNEFFAGGK
jgi:hypothetical protein